MRSGNSSLARYEFFTPEAQDVRLSLSPFPD